MSDTKLKKLGSKPTDNTPKTLSEFLIALQEAIDSPIVKSLKKQLKDAEVRYEPHRRIYKGD